MLVELAAANAAFVVIKEAVANGGDIMAAGQKVFEYFDFKASIQRKANERARSSNSDPNGDWEEFQALEQLRAQEEFLREAMIYSGRPGMWEDWLKFQAESARRRRSAQEAEVKRKKALKERIQNAFWWSVLAVLLACGSVLAVLTATIFKERN